MFDEYYSMPVLTADEKYVVIGTNSGHIDVLDIDK